MICDGLPCVRVHPVYQPMKPTVRRCAAGMKEEL